MSRLPATFFGTISEDCAHAAAELIEIDLKAILALNQGGRMGVRLPIMSFGDGLVQNLSGVTMEDVLAR